MSNKSLIAAGAFVFGVLAGQAAQPLISLSHAAPQPIILSSEDYQGIAQRCDFTKTVVSYGTKAVCLPR